MRVKKTRQDQRGVYRYPVDVPDGKGGYRRTYNVIKPGEDGVTEVMIQDLHRMDDNEVTNNVKNGHPKLTAEQKATKKEWEEAHPGEKYPMDWNLSLNYEFDQCEDGDVSKSSVLSGASYDPFADMDVPDEVLKLREIAANKMTDRQRQAYELIGLEERTIQMLGLQSNVEIGGRSGFIFNTKHGRPIMPAGVNSFLKNIVNAYNKKESKLAEEEKREPELMPPISSHTLRHTGCTRLGENNVNPKVMQYVMGHSDAQITMNVYNHIAEKSHVENEMSKMNLPETVPAVV